MPQPPNNPPKQAIIPQGVVLVLNPDGSVSWKLAPEPPVPDAPVPVPEGARAARERFEEHKNRVYPPEIQEQIAKVREERKQQEEARSRKPK